jgi:hypothetical protein
MDHPNGKPRTPGRKGGDTRADPDFLPRIHGFPALAIGSEQILRPSLSFTERCFQKFPDGRHQLGHLNGVPSEQVSMYFRVKPEPFWPGQAPEPGPTQHPILQLFRFGRK